MSEPQPLHGAALYNPHLHGKEELIGLFAARQKLFDLLMKDLRAATGKRAPQHHLIVGQRGMGKTMLLHRLGYGIEDDPRLSKVFLPLTFPEEQYNVARLSDFWLNCTDALSDRLERTGSSREAAELDERAEALRSLDEERRSKRALDLLTETAKGLGRRLVLLLDNVDLIFDRIGEQDWALREALSANPWLVLIGASANAVESTYDYGRAFYDFFRVHELEGLDLEETRKLIIHYAESWSYPEVKRLAEEDPVRIRVLHNLTGGNPRTIVLLFNVLALGVEGDVRTDLERLLDQCTPLYKARFEALSPQAQQVVHALAVHWDPTSAGELAESLAMDVNAVSSQLSRLAKQGIVEKVPYDPESKTGFQIAERFFNIWYLMRASRRVRRKLLWLVEFLRSFYSQDQLRERALAHIESMLSFDSSRRLRYAEYSFALAEAVADETWRRSLESTGLHVLLRDEALRNQVADLIDLDGEPRLKQRAELEQRLEKVRPTVIASCADLPGWSGEEFWTKLKDSLLFSLEWKVVVAENLGRLETGLISNLQSQLNSESQVLQNLYACVPTINALRKSVEKGLMTGALDLEGAAHAESVLGIVGLQAVAMARMLLVDYNERSFAALTEQLDRTSSPFPFLVWVKLGLENKVISARQLRDASERILTLSNGGETAVLELGRIITRYGHHEEAVRVFRSFLDSRPDSANIWFELGKVLDRYLEHYEEAESAFLRSIELVPMANAWNNLGSVLLRLKRFSEAADAYRHAIDLAPDSMSSQVGLGLSLLSEERVSRMSGRLDEIEEIFRKVIRLETQGVHSKLVLSWFLLLVRRDLEAASKIAAEIINLDPEADGILAAVSAARHDWGQAAEHARRFLNAYRDEEILPLVIFFREAVQAGRSREALRLLDETGASERWRPIKEALEAITRGTESYLRRVAPEVRQSAREIYRQLLEPSNWKTRTPSSNPRTRRSPTRPAAPKVTRRPAGKAGRRRSQPK